MEHIAPLIQTVLWVGLIGVALWRFYEPLYGLLVALQKRVEAGSNVKVGPFELTDLKPQDPLTQQQKAAAEIEEAIQAQEPVVAIAPEPKEILKAKYFQAEDLVLRAIQAEYGSTISRAVSFGPNLDFDGVFTTKQRFNIVEVKYLRGSSENVSRFQASVQRLANAVTRYGLTQVRIILAVVFERAEEVSRGTEILKSLTANMPVEVVVRCFSLLELQTQFGISGGQNG